MEVDESWLEETPYDSPNEDLSESREWRNGTFNESEYLDPEYIESVLPGSL